jgi:hypothetical protein
VFAFSQADQERPKRDLSLQLESSPGISRHKILSLGIALKVGQVGDVHDVEPKGTVWLHDLLNACPVRHEYRSEHVVSPKDLVKGSLKSPYVDRATEAGGAGDVVDALLLVELLDHP